MISFNSDSNCANVRLYYYDFLCEEAKGNIPQSTLQHIDRCRHCQDEINRLEALLAHADKDTEESQQNSAMITIIGLHFAYINKSVTCNTVKPFLTSLAVPALEISIPTPITTHLDNCEACSDDLSSLMDLHLTQKQLYRLGQFIAEKPAEESVDCSQARAAIRRVGSMVFHETHAEVLKHLCICPNCRKALYQYRESVSMDLLHHEKAQEEFPCEEVSATDIFDYCLPYGIDPATDQYAKFRESLTSHVRRCPTCLAKIQQLHTTIYNIAERPDSGVVTCCTLEEQPGSAIEPEPNDLYADWPINVKVHNQLELADISYTEPSLAALPQRLKQRVSGVNLKEFIKPVAAAAIILIGILLLFSAPAAKAVDLSQIYEALEKVRNVCIARFRASEQEPWQKTWISRPMGVRLADTKEQRVLWDLQNRIRKAIDTNNDSITKTPIQPDMGRKIEDSLRGSFGLLPFSHISEIPEDAQWQQVIDKDIESIPSGTKVYDLTWSKTIVAVTEHYKWRAFIDTQTNLPMRAEWYRKITIEEEYTLRSTEVVTYPTDSEIRAIIQNTFD